MFIINFKVGNILSDNEGLKPPKCVFRDTKQGLLNIKLKQKLVKKTDCRDDALKKNSITKQTFHKFTKEYIDLL